MPRRTKTLGTAGWLVFSLATQDAVVLDGTAHAQAPCGSDADCAVDQYCTPAGACAPRCDTAGLCVGPRVSTALGIASSGTHVCFAGPQPDPESGAMAIWSWQADCAPPRRLGSADALKSLLVADGFCYFAGATLERAALNGGAEELVHAGAAPPARIWLGPEHVWWTIPVAQGLEVWRARRSAAATPDLFTLAAAQHDWEAASSTQLFRRVRGSRACDIVSAPLDDLTNETVTRMTYSWACSGELSTDDQSLFFNQYSGNSYQLHRIDFVNPTLQVDTGLSSSDYGPVRYLLNGAWIFAARVANPTGAVYPVTFYRKPKRLDAPPREQLYVAQAGTPSTRAMQFAVLGDAVRGAGRRTRARHPRRPARGSDHRAAAVFAGAAVSGGRRRVRRRHDLSPLKRRSPPWKAPFDKGTHNV